jgi:probable phosphomutase (TIGR03848 family)
VPTVLLVRHGRTTANASGVLAGWTPGVVLDESGLAQAAALADRLRGVPVAALVSSPLERCQQTALAISSAVCRDVVTDDRFGEAHYGEWTGRRLSDLARTTLWRVVQDHPSAAVVPGPDGEAMADVASRAVAAARSWDARVAAEHGDAAVWVAVSHADVIKAVLADALGMHLDAFQRIVVDPCSVSSVSYTPRRPFVTRLNDTGGSLVTSRPRRRRARRSSDAAVGGGAGGS